MTEEMYEDLLKRNKLQIDEYWQLINEQDKHIEELQEQIEEMKCCENCVHHRFWGNELGCNLDFDKQFECDNNCHKYWKLAE